MMDSMDGQILKNFNKISYKIQKISNNIIKIYHMILTGINTQVWRVLGLLLIITVCGCRLMQTQQQQQSTTIKLNTPFTFTQQGGTSKYYQSQVVNPNSDQVLLITVSSEIRTSIQIFVSTSDSTSFKNGTWPSWDSYSQQCYYSSLDTCAVKMPNKEDLPNGQTTLTIYFTVEVGQDCTYTLDVSLQSVFPVRAGSKYTVTFKNSQAAMIQLPASQFTLESGTQAQQIVITSFYSSFRDIGQFQLLAAADEFPQASKFNVIKSKSLNALTQILLLPPLTSANSSYYILVQGQNGTKFNVTIQAQQSLQNPSLVLNDTISYLTNKQINYTYNGIFPQGSLQALTLNLYAYRGYGKFVIDYCNGLYNFSFANSGGEDGEIMITKQNRQQCYSSISKAGGLLMENIQVSVTDIGYQFGYSIGLYEGVYQQFLLPGMKQIGILDQPNDTWTYNVAAYGQTTNFTLTAQIFTGSINISIQSCKSTNTSKNTTTRQCVQINSTTITSPTDSIDKLEFSCLVKTQCIIVVSQNNNSKYSKYSIILSYTNKNSVELLQNKQQFDLIQMNQYIHYYINVSALRNDPINKFTNATQISIKTTIMNGDVVMLTSTKTDRPKFKDVFDDNNQVQYHWSGSTSYLVNSTFPDYIYISMLGDSEGIYNLQFVLNTSANIPAAYLDMIDDAQNDYVISADTPYILIKYISHIIPYSITFDPTPSCIQYSTKLPIPSLCISPNQMPNVFHQQVLYFNLSNNLATPGAVFKFSAYVNSGAYLLAQDRPILIACDKQCYELITVVLENENATILHSGDGTLGVISNTSNKTVSNGPLQLTCSLQQCTYSLNASLKYGGSMQVAYQSSSSSQIEWRTKPMSLPSQNQLQYFYMRLPKYSDYYSFIFYADAADLTVYYNIVSLDQSYTNTINYVYPSESTYMGVSYGDPLQQIHVVDIDTQLLQMKNCKSKKIICIVTMAVALNSSIEYSSDYIRNGLGYYSANTYQYDISSWWPILKLKQQYSLAYFSHLIDFSVQYTSLPYTIHIQALSNCRPQIQTQSTYYLRNYYTDVRLPRVMPGQTKVNYRVLSNEVCLFSTALTSAPYQLLFSNIVYNIDVRNRSTIILTYQHSLYSSSYTVKVSQNVQSIIVNKVTYSTDENAKTTIKIPTTQTGNNIVYSTKTSAVVVKSPQFGQYIVVINLMPASQTRDSSELSVIVQTSDDPITILHNQEHKYVYDPTDNSIAAANKQTVQYEYHSTNNFYIFVSVNKLTVRVIVRDTDIYGPSGQIINTIISNQSQPWLIVNSKTVGVTQILTNYKITCQFLSQPPAGTTATLKLHIQQQGTAGLVPLYGGVSIYDAFVHVSAMNCYKYSAPMVMGENKMVVDISFVAAHLRLQSDIRGLATLAGTATRLLSIKQYRIAANTLRMEMDYYSGTTYKICYILNTRALVGQQYSIVINVPSMPMLYNNQYQSSSPVYTQPYTMFQYINHWYNIYDTNHSVPVSFTVTNCAGTSALLSSNSYMDMLTGKMTDIKQQATVNGVTTALVDVPHGYYYFAVKANAPHNNQPMFRANTQNAAILNGKPQILHNLFNINWNVKAKIQAVLQQNQEYVSVQVPTVIKTGTATQFTDLNVSKIVYSMYLLNLYGNNGTPINYPYSIDAYTRCPSLFVAKGNTSLTFNPIKVNTLQNPYKSPSSSQYVQFKVPIQDFYPMSNITVKADVHVTDSINRIHVIQYYYPQGQIQIMPDSGSIWTPIKWIFILCMLFVCIGGFAFAIKFYLRKRGRHINFQMAEFPVGQEMQNRSTATQQPVNTTITTPEKTNRRPLNASAGYGEFVDQV